MIPWRDIPEWAHQGPDDRFGLCFFAMCANNIILLGGPVMPDVEIESAARAMDGFDEWNAATDRGENLEVGFKYIHDKGWPGDPTLSIAAWAKTDDIEATIARRGCAPSWLMLPKNAAGDDYDFSDDALSRDAPGAYAHAVLACEATEYGAVFITWGRPQGVSKAWADRYWRDSYDVEWTGLA